MKRYTKKTPAVNVVRWTCDNIGEVQEMLGSEKISYEATPNDVLTITYYGSTLDVPKGYYIVAEKYGPVVMSEFKLNLAYTLKG